MYFFSLFEKYENLLIINSYSMNIWQIKYNFKVHKPKICLIKLEKPLVQIKNYQYKKLKKVCQTKKVRSNLQIL